MEERRWHPHHPHDISGASSDDESDENLLPQERNPDLDPQQEIRTDISYETDERGKVNQNDHDVWGEETFQL